MFLLVTKKWGSYSWQATFVLKFQKEAEEFSSYPGAWLIHKGLKLNNMNTQMEDSLLKKLDPEAAEMEIESEWDKQTKIMINQEEKFAER